MSAKPVPYFSVTGVTAKSAETLAAARRTLFAELQRRNSDGRQGIQGQRLASEACGIG